MRFRTEFVRSRPGPAGCSGYRRTVPAIPGCPKPGRSSRRVAMVEAEEAAQALAADDRADRGGGMSRFHEQSVAHTLVIALAMVQAPNTLPTIACTRSSSINGTRSTVSVS